MKTTIEISDHLLARARRVTAEGKLTLRSLVEEGLRRVLDERARARPGRFRLRNTKVGGGGFQPGFDAESWDHVRDEIYGGRDE